MTCPVCSCDVPVAWVQGDYAPTRYSPHAAPEPCPECGAMLEVNGDEFGGDVMSFSLEIANEEGSEMIDTDFEAALEYGEQLLAAKRYSELAVAYCQRFNYTEEHLRKMIDMFIPPIGVKK